MDLDNKRLWREKKVAFPVHFSLQINLHCVVIKYPLKIMLSYTSRWISHYSTMISLCKEENVFKVNQVMLGVHKQHKRCGFCFAFEGNINSFLLWPQSNHQHRLRWWASSCGCASPSSSSHRISLLCCGSIWICHL